MNNFTEYSSDIAFSAAVKSIQSERGSRPAYARMEQAGSWETGITSDLKAFIEAQTSVFLATANAEGQPYIQHRGGPPGFLHVLDAHTIGFADFAGNRQFITTGNLTENAKAHLFLIDYAQRQRVKIWCTAKAVAATPELAKKFMPAGYTARIEQILLLTVSAWDANCPQHIPRRFDAVDVDRLLAERDSRIAALEEEIRKLRKGSSV